MKRTCLTLICGLMLVVAAMAQNKPATDAKPVTTDKKPLPSAQEVVDKYVQASGGKAALEKINSRQTKGTFELPAMGVSATFESYTKAPNKVVSTVDIPSFGTIQRGYNGSVAWSSDPQGGLREMSGNELAQMKLGADFYRETRLMQLFPKMTVTGVEKVNDHDAYVVMATSADNLVEKMYFDTQSGLLVRTDSEVETPDGKMQMSAFLSDYREVDGVKIPFMIQQKSSAMEFNIKLDTVKSNVTIDDAKFNKPASQ